MAALMSMTPSALMGFEGGGCGCTLGSEYVCGLDGYRCFCCSDASHHAHDEGPAFSRCRMGDKLVMAMVPPADGVERAATPFVPARFYSHDIIDEIYTDYYPVLPGRPPTALS
jgi:hypothetical protein